MVGYRNMQVEGVSPSEQLIRHSDGGVPEQAFASSRRQSPAYQAFRWWGTGTRRVPGYQQCYSLSGIPMVGYRNLAVNLSPSDIQLIRHSDGGVPEPKG